MPQLRQLTQLLDSMPLWVQVLIAAFLTVFSLISIYGRINLAFGKRVFSRIEPEEIRSNVGHIIEYTVVPVIVWIGFLVLLATHHGLFY